MTGVGARPPAGSGLFFQRWSKDMRQAFQSAVLAVAVGVQMLTFYSVLYA
ncbi:hypothetical protein GL174_10100 [Sphingobium sp. CAP-1]|nr:hypothetical protein GL174_10100 [Sphingobium sp. CAP-1]